MRKKTVKNLFITFLRFTFLVLPLLLAVVFTYTKLPLGNPSWEYDDDNFVLDGDTLSDRYSTWFLSTIYKPLSSMGLKNTFVYQGTSSLMTLLGFNVVSDSEDDTFISSTEPFSVDLVVDGVVFSTTSANFESYLSTVTNSGSIPSIILISFSDGSFLTAGSSSTKYGGHNSYTFAFYDSVTGDTTTLFSNGVYSNLTDNSFSIGRKIVSTVSTSYNSTFFSALVSLDPEPEPIELSNLYVDFIALYLSYIIFVYLFEVFIRVLVWLPRWIIHFLDKPFNMVGEHDVD